MHRFHLNPAQCQGTSLLLEDREAHHALRVLRVSRGELIAVLDGAGTVCRCEVQETGKNHVTCNVLERIVTPKPPCQITLLQAIPKGKLIEDIIQQATELGVARLVPMLTERTVIHLNAQEAQDKQVKWRHVAVEAIKQCGQPWLPKVELPQSMPDYLAKQEPFDLCIAGALQADTVDFKECFQRFRTQSGHPPSTVAIWIGPEGDFSPGELRSILASGAHPVTFGPLVLRVATAAIYALSVINHEVRSGCR
ncbi:MAG: RsmE family RNA methyltransferase [Verrucomicrobiota bacterium]